MHRTFLSFVSVFSALMVVQAVQAIEPAPGTKRADAVDIESMEMFQAIDAGKIEVNFYPKDATQATVIIKNKGDKPLNVELPRAFGAVHVLGQMGMGGGGYGGGGGGMGGMGGGMGGMGGGGMFRVEPDKTHKMKVPCVCLEHGKTDPNPRMKYKLVPIEQVNNDPRVTQLCALLGSGKVPQNTAQASAWHLANGLSWEELMVKNRMESKYTGNIRFFNPIELQNAFQLSTLLIREYDQYQSEEEPESTGYVSPVSVQVESQPAAAETPEIKS